MNEDQSYEAWHELRQKEWESRCRNCGACCGATEDPCEHLKRQDNGTFCCRIYADRFGPHRTLSGQECICVPVRSKLGRSWPGDERCGYKV
ncbi:MAG: hypothetical protein HGA80_02815 [Candidatus Omnitrophica bacterium]|nr:hypothetical protein [Candidatus Omnitrophota bacterium]